MKVRWNSNALRDFNDILTYLGAHNPNAAAVFSARVAAAVRRISVFPQAGRQCSPPETRRLIVGKYIFVYEIYMGEAVVTYLRHSARKRPWEND